jgi:DNA-binding MarR family transcriptional regulator
MHLYHEDLTMTTAELPASEDCNCFAVRSAARHITHLYDQHLAPVGLRATQFSVLTKLKRRGPLTINALADAMVMDRTTLGRAIQPLQRDGLITIEQALSDRRSRELRLTTTGEMRLQVALEAWARAQAGFEAGFGTKRAAELRTLLRVVVANQFTPAAQANKTVALSDPPACCPPA